ncbi:MAG: hypothetical protein DI551_03360 [Micavibrio aeruginosavorus]|uniref:Uncharacterized protein n=1 Tax=Micavibrio aeruginosavorus TaxID=349221 RepID=A0A2W5N2V0_9BACT|nr:MAG: hypothetical protein DI551_03360 [Micavibrio aeruginosavorus]
MKSAPTKSFTRFYADALAIKSFAARFRDFGKATMRGTILAYSTSVNAGVIVCDEENTFDFRELDWMGKLAPAARQRVEFEGASRTATKVRAEG